MQEFINVGAAALGGFLPALAWLWFWRREDDAHPEPRRIIALAFFAGIITVALVIPIEKFAASFFVSQTVIFTLWSAIEELMKYLAAYATVLRRKEVNEPIDPVIYMVAVALGFAAAENMLFLMSPLSGTNPLETIVTGNLRFVGATLLHVLSSSVIGVALALSFYKKDSLKRYYAFGGVVLAILLHSAFNFFILNTPENDLLRTFGFVWVGLIGLLAVLEFIKRIRPGRR